MNLQFHNGIAWAQHAQANPTLNSLVTSSALTEFGDFAGFDAEAITSAQSGLWSSPTTWTGNVVPGASDHALIQSSHTVNILASLPIGGIIIENGGVLTSSLFDVDINGNLVVDGSFIVSNKVMFSGPNHQTIKSSGTLEFDTLEIDNPSGVSLLGGEIEISGKLNIEEGVFTTNDAVTLLSDPDWTANLAEVKGALSGRLTVQRYIGGLGSNVGYRHFPLPFKTRNFLIISTIRAAILGEFSFTDSVVLISTGIGQTLIPLTR